RTGFGERAERPPIALEHVATRPTRRPAHDLCRRAAEESFAPSSCVLHAIRIEALGGENRPLVLRSAKGVLADGTVRSDHAVARHDQRDWVVTQCGAHRAHGPWPADL